MKKLLLFLFGTLLIPFTIHSQTLSFTLSSDTVNVGDTITFINTSTGFPGGQQFAWTMGDNCTAGYDYIPDSCKIITTGTSAIVKKAYSGTGRYTVYLRSKTGTTISADVFFVNIYIRSNAVPPNPPTCGLIRNGSFDEGMGVNTILSGQYPLIADASPWDRPMVIPKSCVSGITAPPTAHNFLTYLFSTSVTGQNGVPINNWGAQAPWNGNGYTMILTHGPGPGYVNHCYAQQQLPYALIPGEQYLVSFRVSTAEFSRHITKIGAVLTNTNVAGIQCTNTQDNIIHLTAPTVPDVLSSTQINNISSGTWDLVKGTVTGNGQKYITIGRFEYADVDAPTTIGVGGGGANYYVDSVRITPSCCVDADFVVTTGQANSQDIITFFGTSVIQSKKIYVGVDLTINADITFEGCELIMRNDVNINIPAGRKLTVKHYTSGMFSTLSQIYAGCTRMWGSINLQTSTSRLDMNNTVIQDGQTAVLSNSGGIFNINNCTFNKNYIAIKVQNGGSYGGTIYANTFKCDQNISLPPYAGQVCNAAIDIRNTINVNIGNAAQTQNIFTGIQSIGAGIGISNGIKGDASGITAVNNLFNRCSNGIYLTNALQIANPFSNIGTAAITTGQFNTFTNCLTGISTVNRQNLSIIGNVFNTVTTNNIAYSGISVSDPLTGMVNIIENEINDYPFGIGVSNVSLNNADVTIRNNFINQATTALKTMRTGISISNLRTNNFNNVLVRGNRVFFGGAVTNADISTCTPSIFDPCNRIGISVTNCEFPYILENTVNRATNNPDASVIDRLLGIRVEFTANAYLCSNNLTRMGSGVLTVGNNTKIIYVLNTFDLCWNMFRFNNANNIPTQGNALTIGTRDNQWANLINPLNPRITGTFNVANLAIQWDFKNSLPNFNVNPITITPALLISANPITYTPIPLCPHTTGRLAQQDTISDSGDNDLIQLLAAIARDTIEYINYAPQARYWDRSIAYNFAKGDSSLTDEYTPGETAINLFYHEEQTGNIGLIDSLNTLAAINDTIGFDLLNSQLQPQNNMEEYRKVVNGIYAASWLSGRYELTQNEVDILTPIATDNPLWGGDGVYSARVLLKLNHSNQEDEENPLYKTTKTTSTNKAIVYPNPGNGSVNVKFALDQSTTGTFAIIDLNGKLIKSVPLNGITGTVNIDMSAQANGIYFYRLVVNNATVDAGKLVIIK